MALNSTGRTINLTHGPPPRREAGVQAMVQPWNKPPTSRASVSRRHKGRDAAGSGTPFFSIIRPPCWPRTIALGAARGVTDHDQLTNNAERPPTDNTEETWARLPRPGLEQFVNWLVIHTSKRCWSGVGRGSKPQQARSARSVNVVCNLRGHTMHISRSPIAP